MLRLSLTNLFAKKFRLLSTSISVLIGVAFLAGSMVLIDTLGGAFDKLIADINEGVDVVVRSDEKIESGFTETRGRIDDSLVDVVLGVEGVAEAEGSIEGFAQLVGKDGKAIGNPGQGAPTIGLNWPSSDALNQMVLDEGRAPGAPDEIVLDKQTAQNNDFVLGDRVEVLSQEPPERFIVVGIATFGEADSLMGASVTLFSYGTAQRLLGVPGEVNAINVSAESGVGQEELRAAISPVLPPNVEAITGDESIAEGQESLADALAFFNTFMTAFALIALFVASFIIYNTFSILIAQRTRETALLRALGAARRQVIGSVLIEALIVGIFASILGILAGVGVAEALKALLGALGLLGVSTKGVVLEASTAYWALLVGVGVTVVSAVIPAFRASRIAPMAALRDASVDNSDTSIPRMLFGVVILVAALAALFLGLFGHVGNVSNAGNELSLVGLGAAGVFIGVAALGPVVAGPFVRVVGSPLRRLRGLPGELAQENGMRNPKRTATTAAALMIGVGLVCAISIFAASTIRSVDKIIDESVIGDLIIDSGSQGFGGLSPQLTKEVAELDEVAVASGVRLTVARVEGDGQLILAFDTQVMDQLVDIEVLEGDPRELGVSEVALLDTFAEELEVGIGSPIELFFVDTGRQEFTVGTIYGDGTLATEIFVSYESFEVNVVEVFDVATYILRNDDYTAPELRAAVDEAVIDYPNAEVQNLEELKESIRSDVNQMVSLVYALLGLAVLIALLGIANTLALSIVERTREIGLLRALGMTRSQLRAMVRWESFLIALLGTSLGLAIGVCGGWAIGEALSDQGISEFAIPSTQILIIVFVAVFAGVAASIRPASRAAKMAVLDAITRS